jgi:hypothetical protein
MTGEISDLASRALTTANDIITAGSNTARWDAIRRDPSRGMASMHKEVSDILKAHGIIGKPGVNVRRANQKAVKQLPVNALRGIARKPGTLSGMSGILGGRGMGLGAEAVKELNERPVSRNRLRDTYNYYRQRRRQ